MRHKRADKEGRDKARKVVAVWYANRVDQRQHRYAAVNSTPVMTAVDAALPTDPLAAAKRARPHLWTQPDGELTADGTETRAPAKSGGIKEPLDMNAAGGFEPNPLLAFAERAMLHVNSQSPHAHQALEMDAAGYTPEDISAEIKCGLPLAREYVSVGLGVVASLIALRHNLGW